MIDTIGLRIHNLDKYKATVNILHNSKDNACTEVYINEETAERIEHMNIHAYLFHNSNHLELVNHRSSITLPSSHYELSYMINWKADFIEFNFSVPKYCFGSNLFQYIDYYSQTAEKQFKILMDFIAR